MKTKKQHFIDLCIERGMSKEQAEIEAGEINFEYLPYDDVAEAVELIFDDDYDGSN